MGGFHELPNRQHYKNARRGYPFTLGVVRESGLGKSTLIESLFLVNLYDREEENQTNTVNHRMRNNAHVSPTKLDIKENGVKVNLTIVDLPGYRQFSSKYVQKKLFSTIFLSFSPTNL